MKKTQPAINITGKSLTIALLISFSVLSAGAQNIATSFSTSKINATSTRDENTSLSVYPNPAADEAKLVFYSTKYDVPYQVRIVNNGGATLKNIEGTTVQGQNTLRIHLGNYPPGVYYIQFLTAEGREALKMLKQPMNSF